MLVGVGVGVSVGFGVGVLVGTGVSVGFGVAVGFTVGVTVGFGVIVGVAVGFTVGVAVGTAVGVAVGFTVGVAVGVGVSVGFTVGVFVGIAVGVIVLIGSFTSSVGTAVGIGIDVTVDSSDGVGSGVGVSVAVGFGTIVTVDSGIGVFVTIGIGVTSSTITVGVTLTSDDCGSVSSDSRVKTPKATAAPSAAAPTAPAIHFQSFVFFVCSPIVFLSLVLIIPLLDIMSRSSCRKPAVPKRDSGYGVLSLGKGAWFWLLQDRSESFFRFFIDRRLGYADAEPLATLVVVHIFRKKIFRRYLGHVNFMHHAPERIYILAEVQR